MIRELFITEYEINNVFVNLTRQKQKIKTIMPGDLLTYKLDSNGPTLFLQGALYFIVSVKKRRITYIVTVVCNDMYDDDIFKS